jgi:hypothetical protein
MSMYSKACLVAVPQDDGFTRDVRGIEWDAKRDSAMACTFEDVSDVNIILSAMDKVLCKELRGQATKAAILHKLAN